MGWLRKKFKQVKNIVKKAAPVLLVAAGIYFTGPAGLGLWGAGGAAAGGIGGMFTQVKTALSSFAAANPMLGAVAKGAIKYAGYGSLTGAGVALIRGQDPIKGAIKGAKYGALTGAAVGGVSHWASQPAAGAAGGAGRSVAARLAPTAAPGTVGGADAVSRANTALTGGAQQVAQGAAGPATKFDRMMGWANKNPMMAAGIVQGATTAAGALLDTSAKDAEDAERRRREEMNRSWAGVTTELPTDIGTVTYEPSPVPGTEAFATRAARTRTA